MFRQLAWLTMGGFLGVLLTGCVNEAAKPKVDASAFDWAMDQDIRLNTLIRECSNVDSGFTTKGKELRANWEKQYGKVLATADYQFNQKQAAKIYDYKGKKISVPATRFLVEHEATALQDLGLQKRSPNKRIEYCQNRFDAYQSNKAGLGNPDDSEKLLYLKSLGGTTPATAISTIPSLGGAFTRTTPGSALYDIERQTIGKSCSNAKAFTLSNEGQYELYGVSCSGSAGYFVSCEWSQCKNLD